MLNLLRVSRTPRNPQTLEGISRMSSKAKKSQKGQGKPVQEPPKDPQEASPVTTDKNGCICIRINAKPGAKHNQITDVDEEGVGIQICAPPVEGQANTELVRFLAEVLSLRKSDVTLDRGSKSRQKTIILTKGSTTVESVLQLLRKEADSR